MLRTYQPKKLQRKKEHGFRKRMKTQSKGQSEAQLLIPAHEQVLIGNIFQGGAIRPLGVSAKSVKEHDP